MKHKTPPEAQQQLPTLQESLGVGQNQRSLVDVISKGRPRSRDRLNARTLTAEQTAVLAELLLGNVHFGQRTNEGRIHARIAQPIAERLLALLAEHPRLERTTVLEVALDRLLRDVGY